MGIPEESPYAGPQAAQAIFLVPFVETSFGLGIGVKRLFHLHSDKYIVTYDSDVAADAKLTHPGVGYSAAEGLMLVAEEAVEIRALSRQGKSIREIARMLEVSRNTVRRYVRGERLPRYERRARPSKLDDYKQYIAERVKAAGGTASS